MHQRHFTRESIVLSQDRARVLKKDRAGGLGMARQFGVEVGSLDRNAFGEREFDVLSSETEAEFVDGNSVIRGDPAKSEGIEKRQGRGVQATSANLGARKPFSLEPNAAAGRRTRSNGGVGQARGWRLSPRGRRDALWR